MRIPAVIIFLAILLHSCSVAPEPIRYGSDECEHCRMKIMDSRFGSEIVTKKGKIYKYDSFECMVARLNDGSFDTASVSMLMTTAYDHPSALINAKTAFYLQSDSLPSPMGAFLTSYRDRADAVKMQGSYPGNIFDYLGASELLRNGHSRMAQ